MPANHIGHAFLWSSRGHGPLLQIIHCSHDLRGNENQNAVELRKSSSYDKHF